MVSMESDLYILECERRFDLERAQRTIDHGLIEAIDNAGIGLPAWLGSLARRLRGRAGTESGTGTPTAPTAATVAVPPAATPAPKRLCTGGHRRTRLICDDCGAVIRSDTPACSAEELRARAPGSATPRLRLPSRYR